MYIHLFFMQTFTISGKRKPVDVLPGLDSVEFSILRRLQNSKIIIGGNQSSCMLVRIFVEGCLEVQIVYDINITSNEVCMVF